MPDSDPLPDPKESGHTIPERFAHRIAMSVPDRHNPKLRNVMERVNADDDLYGMWIAANVTAIERLGMTDHGPVHVKIVTNIAVRLLRLLLDHGVVPDVQKAYGLSHDDAEVVVALAALLHDVGMSIHRQDHEAFSLFLAREKLAQILPEIYDVPTASIIRSEVLHAIIGHRSGGKPLTVEAGVVRIADALDMARGRSRIPFEAGSMSIHSISAAAIDKVDIQPGDKLPVRLIIHMTNSAGVFQVDQLLRDKLQGSGLEPYIEVEARRDSETERSLVKTFQF
ncbi:MAG: HD domain-containing protein [Gemmatimonadota bacterium]